MPHLNLDNFGTAPAGDSASPAPAPLLDPVPTIDPLTLAPEGRPTPAPALADGPTAARLSEEEAAELTRKHMEETLERARVLTEQVQAAAPPNRLLDIPLVFLTPAKKSHATGTWWWKFLSYLTDSQFDQLYPHIISGSHYGMYNYLKSIQKSILGWKAPYLFDLPREFAMELRGRRKLWGTSELQTVLKMSRVLSKPTPVEARDLDIVEQAVAGADIRHAPMFIGGHPGIITMIQNVRHGRSEKVFVPGEDYPYWHIEKKHLAKWRDVRNYFQNIPLAREVLNKYPFPTPSNHILGFWIGKFGDSFRKFLNSETLRSESDIRTAVTLSLMEDMGKIASEIESYQKEQAKKAKRNKLIEGLMMATVGAILGPAIGAVAASGWGTAMKLVNITKAKAAAVSLDKAARQYAETDLAFSQELERVAMEIDAEIVAQEREEELNQAEIDALAQEEDAYHIFVEGVEVATADTPEEAAEAATKNSEPGQRVEVIHQLSGQAPKSTGLGIRTSDGIERVPPGIEDQVRAMTPEQVRASVEEAERKREPKAPFPWAIVAGGAAAAALLL